MITPYTRPRPTGMLTVKIVFFIDIFRACTSANIQMFADHKRVRIPNICETRVRGLFATACLRLSVKRCGFCAEIFSEDRYTYDKSKITIELNIFGTNP